MSVEKLTLILSLINSTLLALFFLFLKFGIEKRLKKYEFFIGDLGELNRKMHDRLVETRETIAKCKPLPDSLIKRLRMNTARLKKHDRSVHDDVEELIQLWHKAFLSIEHEVINIAISSDMQEKANNLIDRIEAKVDKLIS